MRRPRIQVCKQIPQNIGRFKLQLSNYELRLHLVFHEPLQLQHARGVWFVFGTSLLGNGQPALSCFILWYHLGCEIGEGMWLKIAATATDLQTLGSVSAEKNFAVFAECSWQTIARQIRQIERFQLQLPRCHSSHPSHPSESVRVEFSLCRRQWLCWRRRKRAFQSGPEGPEGPEGPVPLCSFLTWTGSCW